MNNQVNFQIDNIYQNLIQIIQNSELPIGIIYYILKDIYQEVEKLYQQQILIEQKEEKKSFLDESDS